MICMPAQCATQTAQATTLHGSAYAMSMVLA